MDDQIPELDGSSEQLDKLELEPEAIVPTELGGDPLDAIQDEVARAEAKKHRAIARRLEKPEPKVETPAPTSSEFLTKADFFKSNERKAIREITADAEIKAVWNEIIPFYTPRRGKETAEDIKEDILDAITLYKTRNPEVITDDSKNELTTTPVVKTGGGTVDKTTPKPQDLPGIRLPTKTKDWYPSKS